MIPFFRKLRKKMADDNRPLKYARYAIGEILLVVIGILIALQVNTWNEQRKQRQIELKYFYNLKNDLLADIQLLDVMIDLSSSKVKAAKSIKITANGGTIGSVYDFSSQMKTLIFVGEFIPNDNTYQEMKSSGNFSTIDNDDLKLKLMNLKKTYLVIAGAHEHMRYDYNVFLEDFQKYIDWGKYYDLEKSIIPNDPDECFVANYYIEDDDDADPLFRLFVTTKNLMKNCLNSNHICANATYKLIWQGYPVLMVGTTDKQCAFHPFGFALCINEQTNDFEFIFKSVQLTVEKLYNINYCPIILVADGSGA